jgi:LuxR family maltose regulon positive regulatory protein
MPKLPTYLLHWVEEDQVYELTRNGCAEQRFGREGEPSWFHFLEIQTSFAFHGREGRLSLIKETRLRGAGYWYAYRTSGRRTVKRYLGGASKVTVARLEEAAVELNRAVSGTQTTRERRETGEPASHPTSLLLPKLLPPRLPSPLVERPRLLERLDAALECKLTLLVAPAGYGKTTVVNQWMNNRRAHNRSRPLAWVSLDSGDNDLYRFWRYIIAACQMFQQDLGQTALASLSESLQPPFTSPPLETSLTLLLNDLAQQVQGGLLVLDDYHVIEEPAVHETLTFFLDHLPPTLCVLLLTRAEPRTLPLLRWRARGELAELHGADLRFSPEETAAFVRRAFPVPLSDAALKRLDSSLQGWVAGLRLVTLTLSRQANSDAVEQALASLDRHADLSSPYRTLLGYFVTEILDAQPERLQRFLLQTSVLSRLSSPLCAAVTGEEQSTAQLEAIERGGLFVEALDGAGGWYRFHTLFSEAMYREAAHRLGEERLRALSLRASFWYERHAMAAEAVEAALLAHEFERAASLIEQVNMDGQSSELHTARRWLEQMPEAVLRAHPLLCWLVALSFLAPQEEDSTPATENPRVEALLRMAEEGWLHQDAPASLGLIPAVRAMSAWRSGQFARAMEYAQQALVRLPDDRQDRRMQQFRGICLFVVGTGYMYKGQFAEARPCFLEAYEGSLSTDDRHFTGGMLLLVGACSYVLGDLHQAQECYQQALAAGRRREDREIIAQALRNLANISFEWNELATAEQQAHEAQTLALESELDLRSSVAFQLALLAHARGQITSAQQQVAALLARLQTATTPEAALRLPSVLIFSARLALEVGDLQAANRMLETPGLQEQIEARIFQARLSLEQGKPREALRQLERLLPAVQDRRQAIEIQVLLALAHAAFQEGYAARQWLQQALSQGRAEGFVRIFLSEGEPLVRLLRQLVPTIQERELRASAQSVLRAFAQIDGKQAPGTTSSGTLLVEPLSTQEQRVLRLLVAGETNRQIAQELVVSVNTVKHHLKHLYNKLGVSNRLQASEAARRLKLI